MSRKTSSVTRMNHEEFNNFLIKLKAQIDDSVNCSNLSLSDEQLSIILALFENSTFTAKSFDFSRNKITSVGAQELVKFLSKYPIREVRLCNNLIDEDGCKAFLSLFNKPDHLSTCDLSGNPCPEHQITRIHYLAKSCGYPESLKAALYSDSADKVSFAGMKYIDIDNRLIKCVVKDIANLKEVDFSGTGLGDNGTIELGALLKDTIVESVIMKNCKITDVGLEGFIKSSDLPNNRFIKHLDFSENMSISNSFALKIPSLVFNTNTTIISWSFLVTETKESTRAAIKRECELNLQPAIIKDTVVALRTRSLAAAEINFQWVENVTGCVYFMWPYIRDSVDIVSLNLSNSDINDNDVQLLSQALSQNTSLRVLALANNKITFAGIQALFSVLETGKCGVEEINLANNDLADDSAVVIIKALRANAKLKFININVNPRISEDNFREIIGFACINRSPPLLRSILVNLENNSGTIEEIDLSVQSVTINDECLGLLSRALKVNTTVKKLNLSNNIIGDVGAYFFAEALSVNTTLVEVNLSNNSIGNRGVEKLCEVLHINTGLKLLDLSNNAFEYEGVKAFPEMLRVNNSLRKVTMNRTRVPLEFCETIQRACDLNRDAPEVKDIFYRLQDSDRSLQKINLSEANRQWALDDISMSVLCHTMRGKSFVGLLDLKGNNIGSEGCKCLKSVLTHKECRIFYLDLSQNPIDDNAFSELMTAISENNSLSYLNVSKTKITSAAFEYAIPALMKNTSMRSIVVDKDIEGACISQMRWLLELNHEPLALKGILCRENTKEALLDVDLHDQGLTDSSCKLFCNAFLHNPTLRCVNLSSNDITSGSVEYITALMTTCPNLEILDLSRNRIDDSAAKDIIQCLEKVAQMRCLDLTSNSLSQENEEHIAYLLRLNAGSLKLKQILLKRSREEDLDEMINLNGKSNNYALADAELVILADALRTARNVRALDLGNNEITDIGCIALAEVLRNNNTIEAVYLDQNPLGVDAGEALFYALKRNTQLHTLILEGTQIPQEIMEGIDSLLRINQVRVKGQVNESSCSMPRFVAAGPLTIEEFIELTKKITQEALSDYRNPQLITY